MTKRLGTGDYQYEAIEDWAGITIPGVASGVASDSKGKVYVATRTNQAFDNCTGAILVFDEHGKFLHAFGGEKLGTPHHITVGPEDEIFHTDCQDHTVRKYSTSGELLMVLGTPGQPGLPDAPFNQPTCAVRSPKSGDIFVSDGYRQSRIHRFTSDGELVLSWGKGDLNLYDQEVHNSTATPGTGPGEFNCPHGLTVDNEDRVYVQDRGNNRIQIFDNQGNYLSEWEIPSPNQSVIDDDGLIYTASGGQVRISNYEGEHLAAWGERGPESWQFTGGAHGLCLDNNEGALYVSQVGAENGLNKFVRV